MFEPSSTPSADHDKKTVRHRTDGDAANGSPPIIPQLGVTFQ
jgi:hypothetical protein